MWRNLRIRSTHGSFPSKYKTHQFQEFNRPPQIAPVCPCEGEKLSVHLNHLVHHFQNQYFKEPYFPQKTMTTLKGSHSQVNLGNVRISNIKQIPLLH